ncbi:MAG TPA: adenylate/guanylate cyclase domain-containing protein [Candidatus Limnocylindrales bacterium]
MTDPTEATTPSKADDLWRLYLSGEQGTQKMRELMRHIPASPRCKMCAAPFGKPGGLALRYLGYGPWQPNASICKVCIRSIQTLVGGTEVEISILFADIRDSTAVAERISAAEFGRVLNRFYGVASKAIDHAGGIVDKFVGDGVIALFIPGFIGPQHAEHAIAAGRGLQAALMHAGSGLTQLPIGIGVHTGVAYVGVVGGGEQQLDFTALGDPVNTTARLSSVAGPGELLVSADAAAAGHLATDGLEQRHLELKGRTEPVDAWVIHDQQVGSRMT